MRKEPKSFFLNTSLFSGVVKFKSSVAALEDDSSKNKDREDEDIMMYYEVIDENGDKKGCKGILLSLLVRVLKGTPNIRANRDPPPPLDGSRDVTLLAIL